MKVGIIGAGAAGVNAAQVIAQAGVGVTLFSAEKFPPYFKPRLPELAFGRDELADIFVHNFEWYAENGIDLRLDSRVTAFTLDFKVLSENGQEQFDALIITTGGDPVVPAFAQESSSKNIFTLCCYCDAVRLREKLKTSKHMVIVGGGIIGLEVALRAEDHGLDITIIEKMPHLMSRYFNGRASKIIEAQLHKQNIDFLLKTTVRTLRDSYSSNTITVDLENDDGFLCDFAFLAVGTGFDTSMAAKAGLKTGLQIIVDDYLQTYSPGIFAAGDIAQFSMPRPCSAKEASQQGEAAGNNVLAYLSGKELQSYEVTPVPMHLKYKNFEAYSIGKIPRVKHKESIVNPEGMEIYRSCVYENSALAGVQMVGKNKDIMQYQKEFFMGKIWKKMWDVKMF